MPDFGTRKSPNVLPIDGRASGTPPQAGLLRLPTGAPVSAIACHASSGVVLAGHTGGRGISVLVCER